LFWFVFGFLFGFLWHLFLGAPFSWGVSLRVSLAPFSWAPFSWILAVSNAGARGREGDYSRATSDPLMPQKKIFLELCAFPLAIVPIFGTIDLWLGKSNFPNEWQKRSGSFPRVFRKPFSRSSWRLRGLAHQEETGRTIPSWPKAGTIVTSKREGQPMLSYGKLLREKFNWWR